MYSVSEACECGRLCLSHITAMYACSPATYLPSQQCRLITEDAVPIAHRNDVRLLATR